MAYDSDTKFSSWKSEPGFSARNRSPDEPILNELIAVLRPHPRGLRRWSVMRAIRADRNRTSQNIPQKFEEQVERTFRRFCADPMDASTRVCALEDAHFYRPQGTAGEVWALVTQAQAAEPAEGSPAQAPPV